MNSILQRRILPTVDERTNQTLPLFENFLTKGLLSERLSVSKSFINKMMLEGLPCIRLGRAVRFRQSEVVAWLEKRRNA